MGRKVDHEGIGIRGLKGIFLVERTAYCTAYILRAVE